MVYYGRCINGEYCIRGKELGSILLRHRIKASTRFRIHRAFKISILESGFKKLRIRMPDSPDTCGRGNFLIRTEKVADSKISEKGWTGPKWFLLFSL